MIGGAGDDSIAGDAGDDDLRGGPGRDYGVFYWTYHDQNGSSSESTSPVHVDLAQGTARGHGRDQLRNIENVEGTRVADTLTGDDGPNLIQAAGGDDVIDGSGGDDCLLPSVGNDKIDGGEGYDFYSMQALSGCEPNSFSGSAVGGMTIDLSEGYAMFNSPMKEDRQTLISIEGIHGSDQSDTLLGDELENRIYGHGGDDRIEGRAGDDWLDGEGGVDTVNGGDGEDSCFGEAPVSCE